MSKYAAISKLTDAHVRKALQGSVFIAPITAPAITASNMFTTGTNEVQLVTPASSGNTTLTFRGVSTSALASLTADATGATALKAALEGLTSIGAGNVAVAAGTAGDAGKLVVTFQASLGSQDVPLMTVAGTGAAVTLKTGGVVADLAALPSGYTDGGLLTPDGVRFSRATEQSSVPAWQRRTPVRSDKTSDTETFQADFIETNRQTIELFTGADLSAVSITSQGVLSIRRPAVPVDRYYRMLILAVDNTASGAEYYFGDFYPRVKATAFADQARSAGDNAIQWGCTLTSYMDDALGYSKDTLQGGPGFLELAASMGFTVVA